MRFDLALKKWENVTHDGLLYEADLNPGSTVYNDNLYIFFGWNTTDLYDDNRIFRTNLNDSTHSWEQIQYELETPDDATTEYYYDPDHKLARDSFGDVRVGPKYYIFGGFTID